MTNAITVTRSGLPAAAILGAVEPRSRDYFRLGWWSLKALRFVPSIVGLALLIICMFALLYWILDGGNPRLIIGDLVITIAIIGAGAFVVSTVVWWVFALMPTAEIYMSQTRKAAIVMTNNTRNKRWELKNHIVQHTGCQLGGALRSAMATPLQAAARTAGVALYGKAANETVQKLYLKQFSSWGLTARGKKVVVWP